MSVLYTELSVEECKERLKNSIATGAFLPELQCKEMIGGIKGERFWVQRSYTSIGDKLGWRRSFIPVFHGRWLSTDKTEITGHFGIRPLEWVVLAFLAVYAFGTACIGILYLDWAVFAVLAGWIAIGAVCIAGFRKRWWQLRAETLEFVKKTLEATEQLPDSQNR